MLFSMLDYHWIMSSLNFEYATPPAIVGIELELVPSDVGDLWFPMIDQVMRDHVRSAGMWEPEIGAFLRSVFPSSGGVFLDIGANIGYFSRLIAEDFPSAIIHAFEPHPISAQILRLNTWKHIERVQVWPCALGDHRGTVVLETSKNNLGDTKSTDASGHMRASLVAPMATLDELLLDIRADVIKIDVQGAELSVISGMASLIQRSPGLLILFEFSPGLLNASHIDPQAALTALRQAGFSVSLIRPGGLVDAEDREILDFCYSADRLGQANLVLSKR